jgi:hypothetical protein
VKTWAPAPHAVPHAKYHGSPRAVIPKLFLSQCSLLYLPLFLRLFLRLFRNRLLLSTAAEAAVAMQAEAVGIPEAAAMRAAAALGQLQALAAVRPLVTVVELRSSERAARLLPEATPARRELSFLRPARGRCRLLISSAETIAGRIRRME